MEHIKISLSYSFYPQGDHEELFEGMTSAEIIQSALSMAVEDSQRAEPRMFLVEVDGKVIN